MTGLERKYVSRWVPQSPRLITILLVVVAVVNSATLGYDASMLNGLNILPQYKDYFHLNTATTGLNNAASWMGSILGCLLIQPIPDRFGRRPAILVAAVVCLVGCVIQSAAQNIGTFVVGRIVVGLGSQLSSGAAPTLIGELLPSARRGAVLGFFFSCFYVGSLTAAGINYRVVDIGSTWAWRIPSILMCVPSLLAIALLPFVPESPRWLLVNGQPEAAREVLAVVNGETDAESETVGQLFKEIDNVLRQEKEQYPRSPWVEIFATKANRRRLAIIVSFGVMIETLGNFVISFYLGDILTLAGVTDPTTQLQINVILNCWCFAVAVLGSYLSDVVGRKPQTITAISGMIVSLFIFGGLTKVYGTSDNKSGIYGTIAVLFLFQGFYSVAITPMTSLYPMEVLPYKTRNTGIAIFRFLDSGFGLMASFSMSYAMANLGWKFYMINASYDLLFLFSVYFFWVETARVPLEEVALRFGDLDAACLLEGVGDRSDSGGVEEVKTKM